MILVAGDSWSAGEWGPGGKITHNGLCQYLHEDGHSVTNLGQYSGWNGLTFSRLESFLRLNRYLHDQISCILVFQTEWTRDVIHENSFSMFELSDFDHTYLDLKNRVISRFYSRLSDLAQSVNKKIYLIGGASDTIWLDQFSIEYPGLEIACQSWSNLCANNTHRVENPVYSLFGNQYLDLFDELKNRYGNKDLALSLDDVDLGASRIDLFRNHKEFFWPDGAHPNQQGHRLLYDFLLEKIL